MDMEKETPVDLLAVVAIVEEAGKKLLDREITVQQKGNASNLVTSRDLEVEQFLAKRLTALLPGSEVLGEEGDHSQIQAKYLWVIDPIDGTSNFVRDIGFSAVSVGLVRNGEPFLGVVCNPYREETFYAVTGGGAWLNGKPIRVSENDFAHSHLCSAMSLYNKALAPQCFHIISRVYEECDDLRRMGSAALELAYLACGRVELYFEIRLFPWDAAGAIPIIREAGGCVKVLYSDGFPLDKPFPLYAANTKENLDKLEAIICQELPQLPY